MGTRGLLIVLEGVEGVGKTTQWQRIGEVMRRAARTVVSVREPGGTEVGDAIRSVVLNSPIAVSDRAEALLFAASRAQVISEIIQPALERGETVLLDRFLLSTYAYQGAGRGLDMNDLRSVNAFATRGVVPDITLLLTMPLDSALKRAGARSVADRMEREDRAFHARVASAFAYAATPEWQAHHPECGAIALIDATGTTDEVTERCIQHIVSRSPAEFASLNVGSHTSSDVGINA